MEVRAQDICKKSGWTAFYIFVIFIFIFEVAFGASGEWSYHWGGSVRKALFILVVSMSILFGGRHVFCLRNVLFIGGLLLFLLLWAWFVPRVNGVPASHSLADAQFFLGFLFVYCFAVSIHRSGTYQNLMSVLIVLFRILAISHIAIYLLGLYSEDAFLEFVDVLRRVLEPLGDEDSGTSILIGLVDGRVRVFWGGSVLLLLYFHYSLKKFLNHEGMADAFVSLLAIWATATRSLMLGVVFIVFIYFLLSLRKKRITGFVAVNAFLVALFIQTIVIVLMADPGVLAALGISRADSDFPRYEQIASITQELKDHFLMGKGLGASAEVVRSEVSPWSYEMSVFSLFMKIGVWGFVVLYGSLLSLCLLDSGDYALKAKHLALFVSTCLVFMFCANTNPFIFNMVGVVFVYILYAEYYHLVHQPFVRKS